MYSSLYPSVLLLFMLGLSDVLRATSQAGSEPFKPWEYGQKTARCPAVRRAPVREEMSIQLSMSSFQSSKFIWAYRSFGKSMSISTQRPQLRLSWSTDGLAYGVHGRIKSRNSRSSKIRLASPDFVLNTLHRTTIISSYLTSVALESLPTQGTLVRLGRLQTWSAT